MKLFNAKTKAELHFGDTLHVHNEEKGPHNTIVSMDLVTTVSEDNYKFLEEQGYITVQKDEVKKKNNVIKEKVTPQNSIIPELKEYTDKIAKKLDRNPLKVYEFVRQLILHYPTAAEQLICKEYALMLDKHYKTYIKNEGKNLFTVFNGATLFVEKDISIPLFRTHEEGKLAINAFQKLVNKVHAKQ